MKRFSIILVTILLVMTMFVSCSVEVNEPETNLMSLRFRTDDDASKALTASRDSFKPEDYYWFYTANKTDSTPATGTKTNETPVTKENDVHVKGLSGLVGPFSLGKWNFVLKAYTTSDSTTGVLVYSGTVTDYTLTATTETIEVTVEPQKTSGTGKIVVSQNIQLTANGTNYDATTVTVEGVDVSYTATTQTFVEGDGRADLSFDNLAVGSYKVTVAYIDSSTNITHATNTIYVNVWNGLTTTISGTLDEITVKATFNATEDESTGAITQKTTVDSGTATNYEFDYSPASNAEQSSTNKTTISGTFTVPDTETGTLTVDVYDFLAAGNADNATFTATSNNNAVAAVTITKSSNVTISSDIVKVSTTISKGLTDVVMYHSNIIMDATAKSSAEEVTANGNWYYNAETGELVFATSSFSSFHVTSSVNVYDSENNTAYTLATDEDNTIYIFKDKDGNSVVPSGDNLVLLDCSLSNNIPDDYISKSWSVIHKNCSKVTDYCHEENSTDFSGGYGTKIEPYLVANTEQFQNISNYSLYGYYKWVGESTLDATNWDYVDLCGSFNGNNLVIQNLDAPLFGCVWNGLDDYHPAYDKKNIYTIENITIENAKNVSSGWNAAVVMVAGVHNFKMKNVNVHGYIEGATGVSSFVCFGPGNFTSWETEGLQYDGNITFEKCHSDMTIVATSGNATGFIAHAMMKSSEGKIVLQDSDFTGYLSATSATSCKYICGNYIAATITDDRADGGTGLYNSSNNGWLYIAEGKTGFFTVENTKISNYSVNLGECISVDAVDNATKASIELVISPNPGCMTSTYMSEKVDLNETKFTSNTIRYFTIRINSSEVEETGIHDNYYDVVSTNYNNQIGADTVIRFTQYDNDGSVLKVTNISLEDKNTVNGNS